MKGALQRWAPAIGAVLVAAITLLMAIAQRTPEPVERTGFLLDTYVRVVAAGPEAAPAAEVALATLAESEGRLNRYDPASTVAQINQSAGEWVPVDPLTLRALSLAREWGEHTGGRFDVALAPLIDLYDFGGQGWVPSQAEREAALALSGSAAWELDQPGGRARLLIPGARLDLGGLHKGLAVDVAGSALKARGVSSGLVDAGGNMLALGERPGGGPWRIGIQHPRQPDTIMAVLSLSGRAVATSGDYQQYFERGGIRYHHVLDPQTGEPARRVLSVTVLAPTAVEADILSTALFVLGPEQGLALLDRLPGVDAVWVTESLDLVLSPGLVGSLEVTR